MVKMVKKWSKHLAVLEALDVLEVHPVADALDQVLAHPAEKWSNRGQIVVDRWSKRGEMVEKWWSNGGQLMVDW